MESARKDICDCTFQASKCLLNHPMQWIAGPLHLKWFGLSIFQLHICQNFPPFPMFTLCFDIPLYTVAGIQLGLSLFTVCDKSDRKRADSPPSQWNWSILVQRRKEIRRRGVGVSLSKSICLSRERIKPLNHQRTHSLSSQKSGISAGSLTSLLSMDLAWNARKNSESKS